MIDMVSILSLSTGSNLPSPEVQHSVCGQDCSGTSEPVGATEDVGRTKKSEQILPTVGYKGMIMIDIAWISIILLSQELSSVILCNTVHCKSRIFVL